MTRPNVLLIVCDHWAAEHLGVAGNPAILTPGLDEIASCGVRYTNAYSECPVCIPARRTLMTGMSPRSHGDRIFDDQLSFPKVTTLATAFKQAGYQAQAVGKLHVTPQRDRIGFDDVILDDEGRSQFGVTDDYDIYLGDRGYPGRQFDHGMSNNQYHWRPWHLPEEHHATNWAARMMARQIKRRDPRRPSFWYLGFRHPHPPLVPPQSCVDLYRNVEIDSPTLETGQGRTTCHSRFRHFRPGQTSTPMSDWRRQGAPSMRYVPRSITRSAFLSVRSGLKASSTIP